jgi:DHA3 family macrolide efflux protein-like MFS transporter
MRYLNLLRRPGPLLLWVGQVTSTAGDRLYLMAMLWLALQLTGSTQSMAAVSLFESIPLVLVGLIGGALIDRRDRLRLMIGIDMVRAVLVLALPLLYLAGRLHPWHLMAVAVGMGAVGALFDPALQATLPAMVAPGEFAGLAGLMDTPSRFARLLGPGLAGILLTFMPAAHFFTLDSATFAVSAISLIFVLLRWPPPAQPAKVRPARNLLREIPVGWQTLRSDSNLLAFLAVDGVGNLGFPAYTLGGLVLATGRLHAGVGGYGLLLAAYGIGSLAGRGRWPQSRSPA